MNNVIISGNIFISLPDHNFRITRFRTQRIFVRIRRVYTNTRRNCMSYKYISSKYIFAYLIFIFIIFHQHFFRRRLHTRLIKRLITASITRLLIKLATLLCVSRIYVKAEPLQLSYERLELYPIIRIKTRRNKYTRTQMFQLIKSLFRVYAVYRARARAPAPASSFGCTTTLPRIFRAFITAQKSKSRFHSLLLRHTNNPAPSNLPPRSRLL